MTDTCTCCRQTTSDFSYLAGRNPSGRKLTICLCGFCQALYQKCVRCKCLVRRELLVGELCQACREQPGKPVQDVDERLSILDGSTAHLAGEAFTF